MLFFLLNQKERQGLNIISLKNDTGIGLLAFAEQYAFPYLSMFPQGAFNLKKKIQVAIGKSSIVFMAQ